MIRTMDVFKTCMLMGKLFFNATFIHVSPHRLYLDLLEGESATKIKVVAPQLCEYMRL